MQVDRHAFRQRLRRLEQKKRDGKPSDEGLAQLQHDVVASQARLTQRQEALPTPTFPAELPVSERWQEIAELIRDHQVVILCGETGSGKSTQLPKICLTLGRGVAGYIGHTQPRRIAARTLASRIASELGQETGESVGYKVRFHDRVGDNSHIKLMTDGILLAEVQRDRFLNQYDTLIIDEAHERSLNIDFLLGYLKNLLPKRPDLKLIITSATIDPQRFSKHFNGAPVIEVSGRTFPVELRYMPPAEACSERDEPMQQAIVDAIDELAQVDRGDVLVFLSGEREIRETAEHLRKHAMRLTEILPLYARLSPTEQARIFKSHQGRRVVLATNVAETSLTVPGVRHVVDPGFARISRYSHRSKVQRLPVEPVSQASANQRKGRCGRVAEGVCIRLYEEEAFDSRAEFTEPEIQRTNLASVILQMKQLGFGELSEFPFLDPPDPRLINDGYRLLEEIGAVDRKRAITKLGRELARLPVDPRIGKMLLSAATTGCLKEVMVIAAALSVQDPRDRPVDKQQQADQAHAKFRNEESDFLSHLQLWNEMEAQRRHLTRRKFYQLCKANFLSGTRMQEWHDIHQQIRGQMHEMGYKESGNEASYEAIHSALLSGLLSHIGFRDKEHEYLGARNSRFMIFPGSGLFKKRPKWLMAAELVETSRLYARSVATIQPEWIEQVAPPQLLKRSYSEAHWEKKRGQVAAYEKVTLFGITLVPRRKVNFSPIDPVESRIIFIRSALVEQDFHTRAPFWKHNLGLIASIEAQQHKVRRQDLLVDETAIYAFYDKHLPPEVCNQPAFEKWLGRQSRENPDLLKMSEADLLLDEAEVCADLYPDQLGFNGVHLPLDYHFDPTHRSDGVTLKVPVAVINQVSDERCDWLVPGLLRERVIALLRGLPKTLRKQLVPVPDVADACLKLMQPSERPLIQVLAEALKLHKGVYVPEDAWAEESLPQHLRMNFEVVDEQGKRLAIDRDLTSLKKRFADQANSSFRKQPLSTEEQAGLSDWPESDELPESLDITQGAIKLKGFPALVDEGDSVALRVLDSRERADSAHRAGLRRLFMLKLSKELRYLRKNLPGLNSLKLRYLKVPKAPDGLKMANGADIEQQLVALIFDRTFIEERPIIRTRQQFIDCIEKQCGELMNQANEVSRLVDRILEPYQKIRKSITTVSQVNWLESVADIDQQLQRLIFQGFLLQTPYSELQQFPRYLKGLSQRIEKLGHAAARDRQLTRELKPLFERWQLRDQKMYQQNRPDPRIEEIRWLIEELRVSLFAQQLKTRYPISMKRIEKRWRELGL
ncbi:MAG: ATP-dependent RNA helicase HrpA [Candidatus Polarisedimenticolaceae bacterium]|nr:ATP-dependent RNA helicase HrpA [Candidatus Polarisedimenticolaceae bacterium]